MKTFRLLMFPPGDVTLLLCSYRSMSLTGLDYRALTGVNCYELRDYVLRIRRVLRIHYPSLIECQIHFSYNSACVKTRTSMFAQCSTTQFGFLK